MKRRGEKDFIGLPPIGATLYDYLTDARPNQLTVAEIAHDLVGQLARGRLLDVGSGPGKLLAEVHRINPTIELFGLDISESMIKLAKKRLDQSGIVLRQGTIRDTDFPGDYFNCVTATGAFYLWERPESCLNEIRRILKPGGTAVIFDTYRDCDRGAVKEALRENLRGENILRRTVSPFFLKKQLAMTYSVGEVADIVKRSDFARSFSIQKIALASTPIWLRVALTKAYE
jgi:ubiquinone/menaquinone biosynthesis C-methylase UbiE